MMNLDFRTVLAVILISLGAVMLGRALIRSVQRQLSRTRLLAQLLCGIAAVAIGVTYWPAWRGDSNVDWIRVGFTLALTAAILIETGARARNPQ